MSGEFQPASQTSASRWFDRERNLYVAALVAVMAFNARALGLGLFGDDYAHRRFILDHLQGRASGVAWWNMFDWRSLSGGAPDPGSLFGRLPWWASPKFSFALLRPLSAASHFLDYLLWPEAPSFMHAHNIVLLGLTVLLAARLYWRLFESRAAAWLALGLFASADAHTTSAAWIASRNTLLTALFVLLTLWLHVRAVQDGCTLAARAKPLSLLCAHASSEGAVVAWAYLMAYALFLDARPIKARCRSLVSMAAVTLVWLAVCAHFGYGVRGSAIYIDPRYQPALFASVLLRRLPELLEMQLVVPREFLSSLPESLRACGLYGMLLFSAVLGGAALAFGRRAALVRFFAFASVTALVPQCAAGSFTRLLLLSGFAAHGLLAASFAELAAAVRSSPWRRAVLVVFAAGLFVFHGAGAVVLPLQAGAFATVIHNSVLRVAASLPAGEALRSSNVIALNFPDYLRSVFIDLYRREIFAPGPSRMDFLGISSRPVALKRVATDSFELEPQLGYLLDPTNLFVRTPSDAFRPGQQFELGALRLTVIETTIDGRPARIRVQADDLESPTWLWVCWDAAAQRFERCALPEVGATRVLDANVI